MELIKITKALIAKNKKWAKERDAVCEQTRKRLNIKKL